MSLASQILGTGTLFIHILWVLGLSAVILERFSLIPVSLDRIKAYLKSFYREISFLLVSVATGGSLYLSQVLGWEPCLLCWYQRIFMYPLVILFGVGIFLMKDDVEDYVIPVALVGAAISGYHYMVQMIGEISVECGQVSCEVPHMMAYEYITVPLMAFTVFVSVAALNWNLSDEESA